jgi:hypothetical protein
VYEPAVGFVLFHWYFSVKTQKTKLVGFGVSNKPIG